MSWTPFLSAEWFRKNNMT